MSKVESQIDDAKKLALRCKTLELQLRQSVSKKDHHEITSKLERQIDSLERDLDRARAENQKTIALNKQIAGVESLISSIIKTANGQTKILDSIEDEATTRGKALNAQGKVLDAIATKISQGTVPSNVHLQSLSKVRDLEEDKRGMVRRFEYNSLEARCAELSRQLSTMVPSSDYNSLKEKFDEVTGQVGNMVPASDFAALKQKAEELEGTISSMVPREQLTSSESRVVELETRLAEHVPQSIYDELVSRVVSLAEAVTGGAVQPEETRAEAQAEVAETAPEALAQTAISAEPIVEPAAEAIVELIAEPSIEASIPEAIAAQPEVVVEAPAASAEPAIPDAPAAPESPVAVPDAVPEVREIASQLAELGTQAQEAKGDDVIATAPEVAQTVELPAFTFSGTDIVVKTGQEFARAIAKMPASILETDVKSGGLENWFATSLSDASTAESLRKVREGGAVGEELCTQVGSAVAKYAVDAAVEDAAPVITVTASDDSGITA